MVNSNFIFLKNEWPDLYESSEQAERAAMAAPRTSAFYARYALELAIIWIYENDLTLDRPYQTTLAAMMHEQTFKNNLAPGLFKGLNYLRKLGNIAVHERTRISPDESTMAVRHLYQFMGWLVTCYGKKPLSVTFFDDGIIPKSGESDKSAGELKKLREKIERAFVEIKEKSAALKMSQAEVERLQKEVEKLKEGNKQRASEAISVTDISEAETRTLYIDMLLKEAGWDPAGPNVQEYEVTGMPNDKGVGYADYVLWGDDGLPLAVIEAKKTSVDPIAGQHQAKLYADCLEEMHGQRPIIFYTNGYDTTIWDDHFYPPREIQGFYEKDELQLLINRRTTRKDVQKEPVNKDIADRYYQEQAIRHMGETYARGARGRSLSWPPAPVRPG